ncbi:hypothetical protein ABW21_db0202602 [Orbilia brochopaga]|nr:hypothetical protein ABW21_db0202602 [Drechslerella brochopaga]
MRPSSVRTIVTANTPTVAAGSLHFAAGRHTHPGHRSAGHRGSGIHRLSSCRLTGRRSFHQIGRRSLRAAGSHLVAGRGRRIHGRHTHLSTRHQTRHHLSIRRRIRYRLSIHRHSLLGSGIDPEDPCHNRSHSHPHPVSAC